MLGFVIHKLGYFGNLMHFLCSLPSSLWQSYLNTLAADDKCKSHQIPPCNTWIVWRVMWHGHIGKKIFKRSFVITKPYVDAVFADRAHIYLYGLTLIPVWISNHMPRNVWDETTYPLLNFSGCAVEVWELTNNFIQHFIMDVITYPSWD